MRATQEHVSRDTGPLLLSYGPFVKETQRTVSVVVSQQGLQEHQAPVGTARGQLHPRCGLERRLPDDGYGER